MHIINNNIINLKSIVLPKGKYNIFLGHLFKKKF